MDDNGWIKLHRKILTDEKIRRLTPVRRWIFITYLLSARHSGKWRGYLLDNAGKPMSTRYLADLAEVDNMSVWRANNHFREIGLLEQNEYGWLKVKNYDRYQAQTYQDSTVDPEQDGQDHAQTYQNATPVESCYTSVESCYTPVAPVYSSVESCYGNRYNQARERTPKNDKNVHENVQEAEPPQNSLVLLKQLYGDLATTGTIYSKYKTLKAEGVSNERAVFHG